MSTHMQINSLVGLSDRQPCVLAKRGLSSDKSWCWLSAVGYIYIVLGIMHCHKYVELSTDPFVFHPHGMIEENPGVS